MLQGGGGSASGTHLALYEDEPATMPLLSAYLSAFTMPGPVERERSENKRSKRVGKASLPSQAGGSHSGGFFLLQKAANLGVLIGVYLPTIQHIFGVLMFLRLLWMVGSMGVFECFGMVFLCCLCVSALSLFLSVQGGKTDLERN